MIFSNPDANLTTKVQTFPHASLAVVIFKVFQFRNLFENLRLQVIFRQKMDDKFLTMFVYLSKIFQTLFRTGNFLLLILAVGTFLLWTRRENAGKKIVTGITVCFFAIAILPLGQWLAIPLENAVPIPEKLPDRVDGIITMGGVNPWAAHFSGQLSLDDEAEAPVTAIWLARKFPEAKILFSGGSSSIIYREISEASAAEILFLQQGIDSQRMIWDSSSRGTREKAKNCITLAKPKPGETWILITSAVRMPRTLLAFQAEGWKVLPYPVGFHSKDWKILRFDLDVSLKYLWFAIKEWTGLLAYRLSSQTDSFFPSTHSSR